MKATLENLGGMKGKNFSPRTRNVKLCRVHTHPIVGRRSPSSGGSEIEKRTSKAMRGMNLKGANDPRKSWLLLNEWRPSLNETGPPIMKLGD
jgi:hypothetical protein